MGTHPCTEILLAEDNMMNQKVAKNMLKKMGHGVVVANNGLEALKAFEGEKFDLILMDGQMPVMGGLEAARKIRDREETFKMSRIPIIAVSANAMKGDREEFLEAGMDDYLAKPIKRKNLEEVIGGLSMSENFSMSNIRPRKLWRIMAQFSHKSAKLQLSTESITPSFSNRLRNLKLEIGN